MAAAFEIRFPWLSITPLGEPVEPAVKKIAASSSPETATCAAVTGGACGKASPRFAVSDGNPVKSGRVATTDDRVTIIEAAVDVAICRRAPASVFGGRGTTTPP